MFDYFQKHKALKNGVLILLAIILFVSSAFISVQQANATGRIEVKKDEMTNLKIMSEAPYGGILGVPSSLILGWDDKAKQIGIDSLYGTSSRFFMYFGEAPGFRTGLSEHSATNDKYKDKSHMPTNSINEGSRAWWDSPDHTGEFSWDDETTNDLHAQNMNITNTMITGIMFSLRMMVPKWTMSFCNLLLTIDKGLIQLSNLDITSLLAMFHWQDLMKTMTNLFVWSDNGISPILVIAIAIFTLSLLALLVQYLKNGDAAGRAILKEFGFLIISMVLACACMTGGWGVIVSKTSELSQMLLSSLSGASSASVRLFSYNLSDATANLNYNECALITKPYIDLAIGNQFGFPVDELDLWDEAGDSVSQKNWGLSKAEVQQIVKDLYYRGGDAENPDHSAYGDRGISLLSVQTGVDGSADNSDAPNLGYYWWAACSVVNPEDPYTIGDNGKVSINGNDPNCLLFIPDFLAAVDSKTGGSAKAQQIMRQLGTVNPMGANMPLQMMVNFSMIFCLWAVVIYTLFGKIIFNIGIIFIPVIPIFLLIKSTRKTAKKCLATWVVCLVKMVVGSAIIIILLTMSSILCSQGVMGTLLDVVLLWFLRKKIKELLVKVNDLTTRTIGDKLGGTFEFVNNADRKFNDWASKKKKKKAKDRVASLGGKIAKFKGISNTLFNAKQHFQDGLAGKGAGNQLGPNTNKSLSVPLNDLGRQQLAEIGMQQDEHNRLMKDDPLYRASLMKNNGSFDNKLIEDYEKLGNIHKTQEVRKERWNKCAESIGTMPFFGDKFSNMTSGVLDTLDTGLTFKENLECHSLCKEIATMERTQTMDYVDASGQIYKDMNVGEATKLFEKQQNDVFEKQKEEVRKNPQFRTNNGGGGGTENNAPYKNSPETPEFKTNSNSDNTNAESYSVNYGTDSQSGTQQSSNDAQNGVTASAANDKVLVDSHGNIMSSQPVQQSAPNNTPPQANNNSVPQQTGSNRQERIQQKQAQAQDRVNARQNARSNMSNDNVGNNGGMADKSPASHNRNRLSDNGIGN